MRLWVFRRCQAAQPQIGIALRSLVWATHLDMTKWCMWCNCIFDIICFDFDVVDSD